MKYDVIIREFGTRFFQ